MDNFITEKLIELKDKGLIRRIKKVHGPQGKYINIDNKDVLLLCSNDYLGLANDQRLKDAAISAISEYGTGSGASRLVSGTMTPHIELEKAIRDFKNAEAALVFNSGYNANIGVITSLCDRNTEIFSDKLNHASIVDGITGSRASLRRYPHLDTDKLRELLKESKSKRKMIITDGVFSMDGDVTPLKKITELAEEFDALIYLDDAHGTGSVGSTGRGTTEVFNIKSNRIIEMGTFGKALGSFGAYVCASTEIIELIKNTARSFIYTTSLPPAVCAASVEAIKIINDDTERITRLQKNAELLREELNNRGIDTLNSTTQIIPAIIGPNHDAMKVSERLLIEGIFIQAIRPPSVPQGSARLRITVTSEHTEKELIESVEKIAGALK
ncbi:MAG: 8-amino-7-oxononanoate synthase [Deltaproteobacteria bacterium]|nr:8-amino-7-oxononanoate synthase [Deltaproteobacteria bacterium]